MTSFTSDADLTLVCQALCSDTKVLLMVWSPSGLNLYPPIWQRNSPHIHYSVTVCVCLYEGMTNVPVFRGLRRFGCV